MLSIEIQAEELSFTVNPNECIAAKKGDTCVMSLSLLYTSLSANSYCLSLDDSALGCWPANKLPASMDVQLDTDATLVLRDSEGEKRASVELNLRYREATTHRRRVRNPWSLF
ncbi:hypothetical protein D210916BOD24_05880 [Alteromonas sp. D210916BOD_24]|uniref:DUF3019 domain-containing protein n=1 Tax=Alteromonas sp. D210916BOD_24 TaxID=3157618 RepID=UPI00399CB89E